MTDLAVAELSSDKNLNGLQSLNYSLAFPLQKEFIDL